jgi:guanine deaminase
MKAVSRIAHCGSILHFRADPGAQARAEACEYWDSGVLIVADGRIEAVGPASALLRDAGPLSIVEHGQRLIMPGFIDTHIHYPQTDIIGAGGRNLLDWLEHQAFPAEQRFADGQHARSVAEFFLDELLRNGTTTAQVLGTVHKISIDAFFEAAAARSLRMIAGKTLMDRHCPDGLRDSASEGEREMRELIETWHGRDRLHYAITPRFALTSSMAQLQGAGQLAHEYPDVFIHSHLAENRDEVESVRKLFPNDRSYLDVYDRFGLLRERATYAHCIYLDEADRQRLAGSGAAAAYCPSSNLYLGSGLFDMHASDAAGMRFALATDVGGGSSFSMLRTMGEAYKVGQLLGQPLAPLRAFYLATLAGARILGLENRIGQFAPGMEADFIVLDPQATPLLARRMVQARNLSERLLLFMILGDDRAIAETYVLGQAVRPGTLGSGASVQRGLL